MWQRIQTLYLLVSSLLVASLLWSVKATSLPVAQAAEQAYRFTLYLPYIILTFIVLLLNLLALGSYKFRIFQMRTAVLAALVCLGLQIWIGLDFYQNHKLMLFRYPCVFPLVATILNFMAARSILADELLVESVSSLRKSRKKLR